MAFASVVAEQLREPNSNSGVSVQQSVGSSLSRDTCVLKQDNYTLLHPLMGRKAIGPVCCVLLRLICDLLTLSTHTCPKFLQF